MTNTIAYLTGEYPRATDTFIQREIAALRRLGMAVQPFAIRRPGDEHVVGPEQEQERENTIYVLSRSKLDILAAQFQMLLSSPIAYLATFFRAFKLSQPGLRGLVYQLFYFIEAAVIAREMKRKDVTHLHNHFGNSSCSVAILVSMLCGCTFSFTLHGPMIFFEPEHWKLGEKIKHASFVSCISNFCRSQAMIFAPYDCWSKFHIVHCGVEPKLFELRRHEGQAKNILYVGRLANVKGIPILLDCMATLREKLPGLKLNLVGDGPDRAAMEAHAQALGLADAVTFHGYKSQAGVREMLKETDIFAMSSFAEGVPVVLMEAMAAGVPVVATRIAGISELVADGKSGYLVPPSNAEAFAGAIEALARDADRRAVFGKTGREKVIAEFDIDAEAKVLHGAIESVLRH